MESNNPILIRYEIDRKISQKLETLAKHLLYLCVFRLFLFEFGIIITDLMSAAIVYFTYTGGKAFMAFMCGLNAIFSMIFSILKGIQDMKWLALHSQSTLFDCYVIFLFFYSTVIYFLISVCSFIAYNVYQSMFDRTDPYSREAVANHLSHAGENNQGHNHMIAGSNNNEFIIVRNQNNLMGNTQRNFPGRGVTVGTNY